MRAENRISRPIEVQREDCDIENITSQVHLDVYKRQVQDGKTILYSCTQAPFEIRSMLAKILDKPEEDIRVIVTPLGGGFGKKCDSFLEAPAVVAAHALSLIHICCADRQSRQVSGHYETPSAPRTVLQYALLRHTGISGKV